MAQTALAGSSSSSLKRQLHVALEKSNFDHTIKEVDLQPKRPCEISDGKHLARAYRPPKQLHLNFEGHSQGVNCVYWNPTRGNLLLSAAMDHLVCVWDTSCGSTCRRRLACSRLRDGGGKSFSKKKCEKRAGLARFNTFPLYYLRAWHRLAGDLHIIQQQ